MTESIEKRLKRHVIGKPHVFFVVTAPGAEDLARAELAALGIEGRTLPGGVEFTGKLHEGYLANLQLRTAGRVLMRLHAFTTTHFSELEQQAAGIPWELYVKPGTIAKIQVAVHHCKLHHTDGIAERVRMGAAKRLQVITPDVPASVVTQQVFVRGVDDRFTLSLDSSGEHLHLRGVKTHPGRAPMRETIAAAALMRAGYTGAEPLVDPMCGTGTFSLEAALIAKRIPPGWFRDFAFSDWPAFRPQRWAYLRRVAGEHMSALPQPRIFASDIDPEACRALEGCLPAHHLEDAVRVQTADFFRLDPREMAAVPGVVAINPPYGLRLGVPAAQSKFLKQIVDVLATVYRGWKAVLIIPESAKFKPPASAQVENWIHGGLHVRVVVWNVP
jgi:putative N6-adenine-specific DNA methylase